MNLYMLIAAFNKELEGLVDLIQAKFPSDPGVGQTKAKIEMANHFSPKTAAVGFMSYAVRFQKQLNARDEAFFLEQGMQTPELAHLQLGVKWKQFTDPEKQILWEKVSTMNELGKRIIASG